jgi:hypothetical protein
MQRVITLILVAVLCVLTSAPLTASGQGSSVPQIAGKFRGCVAKIIFKRRSASNTFC